MGVIRYGHLHSFHSFFTQKLHSPHVSEKPSEPSMQENKIAKEGCLEGSKTASTKISSSNVGVPSSPGGGGMSSQLSFRSRTDSLIDYTPPMVGAAAGSTFYINKAGHIDYIILLKVNIFSIYIFHYFSTFIST